MAQLKPPLALVVIVALLAMHDLCVAEVGLVPRVSPFVVGSQT